MGHRVVVHQRLWVHATLHLRGVDALSLSGGKESALLLVLSTLAIHLLIREDDYAVELGKYLRDGLEAIVMWNGVGQFELGGDDAPESLLRDLGGI